MTNQLVHQEFNVLDQTVALRHQLLDIVTDGDLAFTLPDNMSLGALCREMAEVERSYAESFATFKQDFSYQAPNAAELERSVAALCSAFNEHQALLTANLTALSDETINTQTIDRPGFNPPVRVQLHIYREALLIFYGKVSIYLRALNKPFSDQWKYWIG